MWFTSLLRSSGRDPGRRPDPRPSPGRRGRPFRPGLEHLERRDVPSTLTVLNTHDGGAGSLRDAIGHAHDGDAIVFAAALNGQTIALTSDELAIRKSLDIEGPGAGLLAVSGNDTVRVFDISEGLTVTIAGLTITHGRAIGASTSGGGGGGVLNAGSTVTLANDVLSDNVDLGGTGEAQGGAVSNLSARAVLTVTDSTFVGNRADGTIKSRNWAEGGAIFNGTKGATATVVRCTFVGNQALAGDGGVANNGGNNTVGEANGGALHNEGASTLTVRDSRFVGNQAVGGSGASAQNGLSAYLLGTAFGGAVADDDSGALVVSGCTFSYNRAVGGSNGSGNNTGQGVVGIGAGGALGLGGPATVANCNFDHNQALGGSDNSGGSPVSALGRGVGGAIQNTAFAGGQAALTLSGSTFTANQAVGGTGNAGSGFLGEGVGGALDNTRGATATVTGSTFNGNQAIGGQGGTGQNGGDGLGGALANVLGSTLTVTGCTLIGNLATGGAGGSGADGGNGFGGGAYNDGQSSLTTTASSVTGNSATGGVAGSGGAAGLGEGGGLYLAPGGSACLDVFTQAHVTGNHATTSGDDIFGTFTTC